MGLGKLPAGQPWRVVLEHWHTLSHAEGVWALRLSITGCLCTYFLQRIISPGSRSGKLTVSEEWIMGTSALWLRSTSNWGVRRESRRTWTLSLWDLVLSPGRESIGTELNCRGLCGVTGRSDEWQTHTANVITEVVLREYSVWHKWNHGDFLYHVCLPKEKDKEYMLKCSQGLALHC